MPKVAITSEGKGRPVLLLHGFPMNKNLWLEFTGLLSPHMRVITVDLPGFGDSIALLPPFSIDDVAAAILEAIEEEGIVSPVVIGHSLGGYVALSMATQAVQKIAGLGLFHSTATADTEEKKQSRDKVIDFVKKNGAPAFTENFIPPLFARPDSPAVTTVKAMSSLTSAETVIGYTAAMRDRADKTDVLKKFDRRVLFIAGEKDPGIPVDSIRKQAALCQQADVHILPDVAHMGMLEAPEITAKLITAYLKTL